MEERLKYSKFEEYSLLRCDTMFYFLVVYRCFFEMSVNFFKTRGCHILGDSVLHIHCCDNFKSNIL